MNTLVKNQIKMMVDKAVREAFNREMMKIRASLTPLVSKEEQRDIERRFIKPSKKYVRSFALRG